VPYLARIACHSLVDPNPGGQRRRSTALRCLSPRLPCPRPGLRRDVAQRWEQVALEDFKRLAPLEDPESASGWLPSDLAIPGKVVIGVTRARLDGRPVETCTVAFTSVPIEAFLKAFFDRTDAEKLSEERDETWTSRLYVLVSGDRKQFVKLRYAPSPNGSGPMAASSIAEE
jgi:hypothetical protein